MLFRSVSQSRYSVIDISNSGASDVVLGPDNKKSKVGLASAITSSSAPVPFFALQASTSNTIPVSSTLRADLSTLQSQFTVLALRQAEALQRWKEISQSGDSDYREQIRKHFGVNLPQALSNMCTYIGGISRNLDISEVVNNNLAAEGDTAVLLVRVLVPVMVLSLILLMSIVLLCVFITPYLCSIIQLPVKMVNYWLLMLSPFLFPNS